MKKTVLLLGGSGFVGSYIVRELLNAGYIVQIFCRDVASAKDLKVLANLGQIYFIQGDICNKKLVKEKIQSTDIVLNLVGIFYQRGKQNFHNLHIDAAAYVAKCAKKFKVQLIHFSILTDNLSSNYLITKIEGEKIVKKTYPDSVIFKMSVVFGNEDKIFNLFAKMLSVFPIFILIGGGKTLFQPVYIEDVAKLVLYVIENKIKSETLLVAGNTQYTLKQIVEYIFEILQKKPRFVSVNFGFAKFYAFFMQSFFGKLFKKAIFGGNFEPLLTIDQVNSLKANSILQKDQKDALKEYGIIPTKMEDVVGKYLRVYRN